MRRSVLAVLFLALSMLSIGSSAQSSFPNKPIRLISLPPGGSTDFVLRLYAQSVAESLGQQIVIDARGGAGGVGLTVPMTLVSTAKPDGYTLAAVTPFFTYANALIKDLPWDAVKSFTPVSQLTRTPYAIVVNPAGPIKSIKDLQALAKSKPSGLDFGASNTGSGTHLISMFFLTTAGIRQQSTYIPYAKIASAMVDLTAGRIDASLSTIVTSLGLVRGGKLRTLGYTSAQRTKAFPDVPTIAEQGLPGFSAYAFIGWLAPANTPADVVIKLSAAAAKAAQNKEIASKMIEEGGEAVGSTPQEFAQFIAVEVPRWRQLVSDLGIKAEE